MRTCLNVLAVGLALFCAATAAAESSPGCLPLSLAPLGMRAAVEGKEYRQGIAAYGGKGGVTFAVTEGGLPPQMALSSDGTLSGAPSAAGTFTFTVTATDSCTPVRQQASQRLTLEVLPHGYDASSVSSSVVVRTPLKVAIKVGPGGFAIPSGGDARVGVVYDLKAEPAATAVLESPGGTFAASGTVLGSAPVPMTAVLVNGMGRVEETVTIPQKVVEQAQADGATKLVFSRPFMGHGTTALAVVEIAIPPAAKGRGGAGPKPPR